MSVSVHNIYPATLPQLTSRKAAPIPELTDRDRFRFWAKVERAGDHECWLWTASRVPGWHGQMTLGKRPHCRPYYAHRIAWTLAHGPIPDGKCVCHTCDQPICCNVAHMFLGDQAANVRDAMAKGRLALPRKRNRAKRDEAVARYLAGGISMEALAEKYGVHELTILRWCKGHHKPYAKLSKKGAA